MSTYEIEQYELHVMQYRVEADSEGITFSPFLPKLAGTVRSINGRGTLIAAMTYSYLFYLMPRETG